MVSSQTAESFRDLLLRYRGRSGLTQRELGDRVGVNRRSVQEWENGANYPSAERLEALLQVLLEAGGLSAGREAEEAEALWAAVERASPRTHARFDQAWFDRLLAQRAAPPLAPESAPASRPADGLGGGSMQRRNDWGEAPDTSAFVGRTDQLALLRRWVLDERCRLVAILGMGGIGKTMLGAKLAADVAGSFERIYWRSLRDAPPLGEWLAGAIDFMSDHRVVPPAVESERLTTFLKLLRERRCLLVLDNFESLFESGQHQDAYRHGLASYGRVLEVVAAAAHRSCLILTSREAPANLGAVAAEGTRRLHLGGLGVDEAQALLAHKQLEGTGADWAELVAHFGGNGLALKMASENVRELFNGAIGGFLEVARAGSIFGAIRRLLAGQVERGSVPEQQVLRFMAIQREPVRTPDLLAALGPGIGRAAALEAVEALLRRSLIERAETPGLPAFTIQSVVLDYVTERLVQAVADEIARGQPALLMEQPLIGAQAKQYVRQMQERLIGTPIVQTLSAQYDPEGARRKLLAVVDAWRGRPSEKQGYGPGNVVNLLRLLPGELRGLDLSRLTLCQAYLAEVEAQDATLADTHLAESVLAGAFDFPTSVALSGDGNVLVAGTSTGEIGLWRVADYTPVWAVQGHTGMVWGLALSADGHMLASCGNDGMVRLWEGSDGSPLVTLQGHTGAVWSVALSTDGSLLASGGADETVRLWEASTGRSLATLPGHTGAVWGVALSADGRLLASGGADGTARLWEASTGRSLATLAGHTGTVYDVALSADGRLLASGGEDGRARLWEADNGRPVAILEGHTGTVYRLALSADGDVLASGGGDGAVRLWETGTGRPLATLQGHTGGISGVALSADGGLAASDGEDGTVRLWEAATGRPVVTLQGHSGTVYRVAVSADGHLLASGGGDGAVRLWEVGSTRPVATLQAHNGTVWGLALSADGHLLASGGGDGTVRLWEASTGRPLANLDGHTSAVWGVALSADGHLLASGGGDRTARLWEAGTGRPLATLRGHAGIVYHVALSADGHLLASSSTDGTVRLWEAGTGRCVATLQGHTGAVWSVALSADGHLLASGGNDGTVRLWEAGTGRSLATLEGHTGAVWSVVLSADGHLLASGGNDGTVRLWEDGSGQPVATLQGHTGAVWSVALSTAGQLVASSSFDGTVRLWSVSSAACLGVLRPDRRYERLDITGMTGITEAERAALLALGAVEHDSAAGAN